MFISVVLVHSVLWHQTLHLATKSNFHFICIFYLIFILFFIISITDKRNNKRFSFNYQHAYIILYWIGTTSVASCTATYSDTQDLFNNNTNAYI